GLAAATKYYYRVRATNTAGDSAYSSTASATTQAAATPPAAPSKLAAVAVSGSQVSLTWADNASNETGFKLYRSGDGVNWVWFAQTGPNATAYTWWGGSPGSTYFFYVRASNAIGDSDPSNTAAVTTLAPPAAPGE